MSREDSAARVVTRLFRRFKYSVEKQRKHLLNKQRKEEEVERAKRLARVAAKRLLEEQMYLLRNRNINIGAVRKIQRLFRQYLRRCLHCNQRRIELLVFLKQWAQGSVQKLLDNAGRSPLQSHTYMYTLTHT